MTQMGIRTPHLPLIAFQLQQLGRCRSVKRTAGAGYMGMCAPSLHLGPLLSSRREGAVQLRPRSSGVCLQICRISDLP